jgi:hypothetical protein
VKALEEKLGQYRLEKKAAQQARRGTIDRRASPIEQAYNEALLLVPSDPQGALERFEALIAVFGAADDTLPGDDDAWLKLARQQVARLTPQVERIGREHGVAVRKQLERAEVLAGEDAEAARRIWRGIITLYQDKAWARDLVSEARDRLSATGS